MRSAAVSIRTDAGHPAGSIDRIRLGCQRWHLGEGKSDTLSNLNSRFYPNLIYGVKCCMTQSKIIFIFFTPYLRALFNFKPLMNSYTGPATNPQPKPHISSSRGTPKTKTPDRLSSSHHSWMMPVCRGINSR